jgi:hypothetical protein
MIRCSLFVPIRRGMLLQIVDHISLLDMCYDMPYHPQSIACKNTTNFTFNTYLLPLPARTIRARYNLCAICVVACI